MMRAVEILNKKEIDKKAREAQKEREKEDRRKVKEDELDVRYTQAREAKEGIAKPWWKVW